MSNKHALRFLIVSAIFSVTAAHPVFAYIDPGTGMSFVSGIGAFIIGFIALAFGAIAVTFKRWMAFIKGLFKKKEGGGHPR